MKCKEHISLITTLFLTVSGRLSRKHFVQIGSDTYMYLYAVYPGTLWKHNLQVLCILTNNSE